MRKASTPIEKPKRKVKHIPTNKPKYNEEQVTQAIKLKGGAVYATADYLDINVQTLYAYFKRWPRLKKVRRNAKKLTTDQIEHKLVDLAKSGDIRAIRYYLSCQAKDRGYGNVKEVKVEHNNIPQAQSPIPELTDDLKRQLLDRARAQAGLPPLPAHVPLQIGVQELPVYPINKKVVIDNQPSPGSPEPNPSNKTHTTPEG